MCTKQTAAVPRNLTSSTTALGAAMSLLSKTSSEKMPLLLDPRGGYHHHQPPPVFPPAPFADALPGGPWGSGRRMPQAIAHRGYKAEWPENTMCAFEAAMAVGAHAIETDLHLTKDKVVVLSHDGTMKRCFGIDAKIADCDWAYLSTLRTTRSPPSPMPRLADLLHYLAQPGMEAKWLLLDIKRDDDADELIRRTAETLASVPSPVPWKDRIIMGCWDANYMRRCGRLLPGLPVAYIGWSLPYAWQLLKHANVSFNLLQKVLVGPLGGRFVRAAEARGRQVFVWTVNQPEWMGWSIRRGGVDGVITDDPKAYVEMVRRFDEDDGDDVPGSGGGGALAIMEKGGEGRRAGGVWRWTRLYAEVVILQILARILIFITRIRLGSERRRVRDGMRG